MQTQPCLAERTHPFCPVLGAPPAAQRPEPWGGGPSFFSNGSHATKAPTVPIHPIGQQTLECQHQVTDGWDTQVLCHREDTRTKGRQLPGVHTEGTGQAPGQSNTHHLLLAAKLGGSREQRRALRRSGSELLLPTKHHLVRLATGAEGAGVT